jgi:hypothetical protein
MLGTFRTRQPDPGSVLAQTKTSKNADDYDVFYIGLGDWLDDDRRRVRATRQMLSQPTTEGDAMKIVVMVERD